MDAEYGLEGSKGIVSVKAGSFPQAAVNLIRCHMNKPEFPAGIFSDMGKAGFQQPESPCHIGVQKHLGSGNGAVHMGFRHKMEHPVKPVGLKQAYQQISIADVAVNKGMPGIIFQMAVVGGIARIGQGIQIENILVRFVFMHMLDKIGSNKPAPAGEKNMFHGFHSFRRIFS